MSLRAFTVAIGALVLALGACSGDGDEASTTTTAASRPLARLTLTSPAFPNEGSIPRQFTCDGAGQSPPLAWSGVPEGTSELALSVEDPDAPRGVFVHWVLFGIPPTATSLPAGASGIGTNGTNSFDKRAYGGPCPPKGSQHRYVFTLVALSQPSQLTPSASASDLRAVEGAVASGRLVGLYGR